MKDFLLTALKEHSDVSSKRVSGFITLIYFLILMSAIAGYLWAKGLLQDHLNTLIVPCELLIAGFFGLTAFDKVIEKGEKK
jgi:hypothetical protein